MGSDYYHEMQSPEHNRRMGAYEERKRILERLRRLLAVVKVGDALDYRRVVNGLRIELEASIAEDERRMAEGPL